MKKNINLSIMVFSILLSSYSNLFALTGAVTAMDKSPLFLAYGLGIPALATGFDAIKENPAGMAFSEKRTVGIGYESLQFGLFGGSVGYAQFLERPQMGIGVNIFYLNKGSVDLYTEDTDSPDLSLDLSDIVVSAAVSKQFFDMLGIGGALKYISYKDIDNLNALSADAGLRFIKTMRRRDFSLQSFSAGVQVKNLFGTLGGSKLQMIINGGIGVSVRLDREMGSVRVSPGFSYSDTTSFGGGVAYENILDNLVDNLGEIGTARLIVGMSYGATMDSVETSPLRGFSTGATLDWEGFGLGLGVRLPGDILGTQFYTSLSYSFKSPKNRFR